MSRLLLALVLVSILASAALAQTPAKPKILNKTLNGETNIEILGAPTPSAGPTASVELLSRGIRALRVLRIAGPKSF